MDLGTTSGYKAISQWRHFAHMIMTYTVRLVTLDHGDGLCVFWCHTFCYSVNVNMKVWGQNRTADKDTIKLKTRKMYSIMFILYVTIFKQLQISRTDDLCKCQSYKSLSQSKIVVYPE